MALGVFGSISGLWRQKWFPYQTWRQFTMLSDVSRGRNVGLKRWHRASFCAVAKQSEMQD